MSRSFSSERRCWTVALAALGAVLWLAAIWVSRDSFVDREEGQHLLRALDMAEKLDRRPAGGGSLAELLSHSREDWKAHYGWPYYLALALAWKALGRSTDLAFLLNVASLLVLCGATAVVARRLGGAAAAAPAVTLVLASSGVVSALRLLSPALFSAAAAALAAALLLASEGLRRPGVALAAGAAAGTAAMVKAGLFAFFAVPLVVALGIAVRGRRRRGAALLALGALPGLAWSWIHRDVFLFWSGLLRGLNRLGSAELAARVAGDVTAIVRPLDAVVLVVAAVAVLGGGSRDDRRQAWMLLCWAALPLLAVLAATGNPGQGRDYLASLVPLAVLAGMAARSLGEGVRTALLLAVAAAGLLHASGRFLRLVPDPVWPALDWPRGMARPGERLLPSADGLAPLLSALEGLGVEPVSRCGCLPFPPYPVPADREHPVVLFDAGTVGPENVGAWLRLHGRSGWQVGLVPYGLSEPLFEIALDCASAVVLAPAPEVLRLPDVLARQRARRERVDTWGRAALDLPDPRMAVRRAEAAGLCQSPLGSWTVPAGEGGAGRFYALHLDAVRRRGLGEDDVAASRLAATAAAARRDALERGDDPAAVLFGELYLARAVAEAGAGPW